MFFYIMPLYIVANYILNPSVPNVDTYNKINFIVYSHTVTNIKLIFFQCSIANTTTYYIYQIPTYGYILYYMF